VEVRNNAEKGKSSDKANVRGNSNGGASQTVRKGRMSQHRVAKMAEDRLSRSPTCLVD
jgi:hypothetical protein